MPSIEDITPDDSVVPVYSVVYEKDDPEYIELVEDETSPDEMIAAQQSLKESALAKLALLGLTEEEAKAVIGMS